MPVPILKRRLFKREKKERDGIEVSLAYRVTMEKTSNLQCKFCIEVKLHLQIFLEKKHIEKGLSYMMSAKLFKLLSASPPFHSFGSDVICDSPPNSKLPSSSVLLSSAFECRGMS